MTEDTIAAISTPIGEGGIAIVRMSGPHAFEVADAIFVSKRGLPSTFPTHTIHFGRIGSNGNSVDQVMLSVMAAPQTFTGENIIEINCHGGMLTPRTVLGLCLAHGARLAEPGEFTKRAFLNGRLDLTQAEAVMDLIQARTSQAHVAATQALEGHLSRRLDRVRESILNILAHIEAHIDFPDDEIDTGTTSQWLTGIQTALASLQQLLATAAEGKLLRQGVSIAIIGRPNAGKSSLLNALLGEDRAIVTSIPGTTRDTIEESANIRGIPVRLTDTAGIRKPRGAVEEIGIRRSRECVESSDLVIHVLDGSRAFSDTDSHLSDLCGTRRHIQVLAKSDLPIRIKLPAQFAVNQPIPVSSVRGDGIESLRDRIELLAGRTSYSKSELDCFINDRQADVIRRAIYSLTATVERISSNRGPELISQELRAGLNCIGEITGKTATEDILASIFGKFCIGK